MGVESVGVESVGVESVGVESVTGCCTSESAILVVDGDGLEFGIVDAIEGSSEGCFKT